VFDRYLLTLAPGVLAVVAVAPGALAERRTAGRLVETPAHTAPGQTAGSGGDGHGGAGRIAGRLAGVVGGLALAVVLASSAALAASGWSFDRVRWSWAEQQVAAGQRPDRVDAGLEWLGWWSPNGVIDRTHSTGWGWEGMFSTTPSCVVLTPVGPDRIDQLPTGWTFDAVVPYRTWLVAGHSELYSYRTGAPDCGGGSGGSGQ
jgi:hypothetical protein